MSHINETTLRVLTRAQKMKNNKDDAIIIQNVKKDNTGVENGYDGVETRLMTKFSNKNGFPFLSNLNQSNGTAGCNGKASVTISNGAAIQDDATKLANARDRFRSAGMKARLARRMERIIEDRMTVKQIFKRYVQDSTLHGFRFIFMQTFYVRRFAWFVITMTMAIFFFKELKESIELFYAYPFSTTSTVEYVPKLKFPAISICNLNEFQVSKLMKTKLKKLYEADRFPLHSDASDPGYDIEGDQLADMLHRSSQSVQDMFRGCEWIRRDTAGGNMNPCDVRNFTSYTDLNGQLCYTFNSGKPNHRLLDVNETGLNIALTLTFDLQTNESLRPIEEVGLRVIVHDQEETPLQNAGFIVSPGFQTFVEINVRKTQNLRPPYETKCGERRLRFTDEYRQSKCFLEQLTDHVQKTCNCRGVFLPDEKVPLCSLNQTVQCLIPAINNFDKRTNTECPVDCVSYQYITSLSYARFLSNPPIGIGLAPPTENKDHWHSPFLSGTAKEIRKHIQENVVVIQFFYQELMRENVQQESTYDFYKLVGDVGGQLGLMLGASVLTLVEFVDLFLFTIYHQLLRLSRRKKREREEEEKQNNLIRQSILL